VLKLENEGWERDKSVTEPTEIKVSDPFFVTPTVPAAKYDC